MNKPPPKRKTFKIEPIQAPIIAEPVEQEEFLFITPKKLKEEPIYTRVDQDLLQKYLNVLSDMTLEELKNFSKNIII